MPGGARWVRVFGGALVVLLLAQLATGVALAFTYAPSATAAWASVAEIERSGLGRVLRGLHAHGATFLIGVASLHLLQTIVYGAHRPPRTRVWWLGVALLCLLMLSCLTGSFLPWDERGYWAARMTAGLLGRVPLIGAGLSRMALGSGAPGNSTLSRSYALHATVLPLAIFALGAAHLAAVRENGLCAPPRFRSTLTEPFWPGQALRDAAFSLLLLAALFALARFKGPALDAPADPGGVANPRPEWYFRPFFELLRLLPAAVEGPISLGAPVAAVLFLALLPRLDRSARTRRAALACVGLGMLVSAGLALASYRADAVDARFARAEALAHLRAQKARKLASGGVPPEGALALLQNQPEERGARLFARTCTECHAEAARAPLLDGFLSKQWIHRVLEKPVETYATAKVSGMRSYAALGEEKLGRLTDFLHALRSHPADDPALESGRRLFKREGCGDCHSLVEGKDGSAPTLAGYGSTTWLHGFLRDPGIPAYYGAQNRMPDFGNRLPAEDIDDLVAWLSTREDDEAALEGTP